MDEAPPESRLHATLSVVFASVLLCRAGAQLALAHLGFVSVSADEWTRALEASSWAQDPRWLGLLDGAWLPLETYLNGAAIALSGDAFVAPRLTVFAASCGASVALLSLTRSLFGRLDTALVATALLSTFPWFWWLSGTPMLEMYFLAPLLAAVALLVEGEERRRARRDLLAAGLLALSTAFHLQAWLYVEVVVGAVVVWRLRAGGTPFVARARALLPFVLIANVYVLSCLAAGLVEDGSVLEVLREHTHYSRARHGGYDLGWLERLAHYPRLLLVEAGVPFLLLAAVGGHDAWRSGRALPLVVAVATLVALSLVNLVSVPATAAPGRFTLGLVALLAPYAAHGAVSSSRWLAAKLAPRFHGIVAPALCVFVLSLACIPFAVRALFFPTWAPGTVAAGEALSRRLAEAPEAAALVEVVYWDFRVIEVLSGAPERVKKDRRADRSDRAAPSLLRADPRVLERALRDDDVRFLVLRSPRLRARAEALLGAQVTWREGEWALLELPARSSTP